MEVPLNEALHLFVGKTIERMDAACCNNIEFKFTDGSKVAIHIDVDGHGLPEPLACTHCVEIN